MKRLGILTGGGDAPGLNAVIRAVVKTTITECSCGVIGIRDGYEGFLKENGIIPLSLREVHGILPRGGTILGTANRGNPFAQKVIRGGVEMIEDISDGIVDAIQQLKLDGLLVVGGDGTLRIANELNQKGVPAVGIPKTIDNDVGGTDVTFGFDSALSIATEAIDRIHTTAEAHHRVMVVELMGRDAGFIALHAGVAGGADVILIPEIPFNFEAILNKVHERMEQGSMFSIIAVSEGAKAVDGKQVYSRNGDDYYASRLGGIGQIVATYLESQGIESRVTVLGHLQRGGSPTAFDRWLATRFGSAAVRLALNDGFGRMVALQGSDVIDISFDEALTTPKRVRLEGDGMITARSLGISFGDWLD